MAYSRDAPIEESGFPDTRQSSLVVHTYGYFSSHQSSDGLLVHSGRKSGEGYRYIAPDGTTYQRNWTYNEDGSSTGIVGHGVTGPVVNDKQVVTLTIINLAKHTYSRTKTEYLVTGAGDAPKSPTLGLASSPLEVQRALQGDPSQKITTTINDTPAIALSLTAPRRMPDTQSVHLTLYVDAKNCQPLRTVTVIDGLPSGPYVADWMPATPDNIARAKDHSIPAGYTKVDRADAV
ncbi:MAG TPA: hypothetical protein VGG17_03390 [Acidimicrobiales bacterium]